jgi:hypothetical protein
MVKFFRIIGLIISLLMSIFCSLSAKETYLQPAPNQQLQSTILWNKELPPSFSRTVSDPASPTESQPLTPVSPKPIRILPVQPTLTLPKVNAENFKINRKKEVKSKLQIKSDNPKRKVSGTAIAGFVLGFLGFALCLVPVVGLIFSIIGLIFSANGLKQVNTKGQSGKGFAVAGLVLSIIGLVFSLIVTGILIYALIAQPIA